MESDLHFSCFSTFVKAQHQKRYTYYLLFYNHLYHQIIFKTVKVTSSRAINHELYKE